MNILTELGLAQLPEKDKRELLESLSDSFLRKIIAKVYERLDETGRLEFEKIADENDAPKLTAFIKSQISDFEEIQNRELQELIAEIKSLK